MSRWAACPQAEADPAFARLLMGFMLSLRGSVSIYQGEELAVPTAVVAPQNMRNPFGIAFYPEGQEGLVVVLNLGEAAMPVPAALLAAAEPLEGHGFPIGRQAEGVVLPRYGMLFAAENPGRRGVA